MYSPGGSIKLADRAGKSGTFTPGNAVFLQEQKKMNRIENAKAVNFKVIEVDFIVRVISG